MAKKPIGAPPKGPALSLGGSSLKLGGAGLSLDPKKAKRSAIDAPMPTGEIPGEPLDVEREAKEELALLQAQFQHPDLAEAEPARGKKKGKKLDAKAFDAKKQRETERRNLASETTYYACLVFSCTDDLNKFLTQLGVLIEGQFLDGYEVAEKLGFHVPRTGITDPNMNVLDRWEDLALTIPEAPGPTVDEGFDEDFE